MSDYNENDANVYFYEHLLNFKPDDLRKKIITNPDGSFELNDI